MASFRFLHAADLHLDTPFEGIGALQPALADRLKDASLQALDRLVEIALREDVAFVLLAGDLYDGQQRGVRAQVHFRQAVGRLSQAGIASFIVHGNHDPVEEGWFAIREWPPLVTVFGPGSVAAVPVVRDGLTLATIQGVSYAHRETQDNLARRFRRKNASGFEIGLLHTSLDSSSSGTVYAPCTVEDLVESGLDYWALGHVHRRQIVRETFPAIVFPGNTQGRSFKPAERGAKGVMLVDVVDGKAGPPRFVAADGWRFEELEVDIGPLPDLHALHRTLVAAAGDLAMKASGRGLVLRARLSGRGPLHGDFQQPGAVEDVLAGLRQEAGEEIWWDSLLPFTAPPFDLNTLRGRQDFLAELLRVSESWRCSPETARDLLAQLVPHNPVFTEIQRVLDPDEGTNDPRQILAEAENLALGLLLPPEEEP